MASTWIERVTGSIEHKRHYRQYRARKQGLPANYRASVDALERYLLYFGAIAQGDVLVSMLDDLLDLFEQAAANATPIRAIVGDDPVAFAEDFLHNYADGQWINKERDRLVQAIDRAERDSA